MSVISAKFLSKLRNLKTDAAPQPPRASTAPPLAHVSPPRSNPPSPPADFQQEYESYEEKKDSKPKFSFKKNKKEEKRKGSKDESDKQPSSPINTQATGPVINIVNSSNVHWGPEITYNTYTGPNDEPIKEEDVKKTQAISTLLTSKDKLTHVYMDYISKNLGKNWKNFFRSLGYTSGRIETVELSESHIGISEVRYKLLLDWVRNEDDSGLGRLSSALWSHGEKHLVKGLADIYQQRK